MTDALPAQCWSARKWTGMTLLIFIVQMGLIFWLSEPPGASRKIPHRPEPGLRPAPTGEAEFIALQNPTLFALPQPESFSGLAWLNRPALPVEFFEWTAAPALTALTVEQLQRSFASLLREHEPLFPQSVTRAAPKLSMPVADALPGGVEKSSFRLTGELTRRTLLSHLTLPAFPHTDVLTNTVIRLALGASGIPVSIALVARSGSTEADELAMRQTRGLRFAPLPGATLGAALSTIEWGEVVFEWATLASATNSPTVTILP